MSFHSRTRKSEIDVHPAALDFAKNWAMPMLDRVLMAVSNFNRGMYVAPRMMTFCLKVVANCINIHECSSTMQPFLEKIMLEYCLPLLALNEKDEEYWKEEPLQFVYSENCKTDDHNMLKNAAEELIKKIAETRPQPRSDTYMHSLKNFIFASLNKMENQITQQKIDPLSKEYMLHALQATTDVYKLDKKIRNELEGFTVTHVIPELFSDSDILKYRCLSLYSRIGFFFSFKDHSACLKACQGVSACLASKVLPLKIAAAEAMCVLLRNQDARQMMRGDLLEMLEILLQLLNDVDYDGLVHSLEAIIESFGKDIEPHSAKIIEGLGVAYYNFKGNLNAAKGQKSEDAEVENSESERAASACLQTMANLLKTNLNQEIYLMCVEPVLKILNITILENDEIDFQNSMTLLNLLLYKNETIDNNLAFYFPIMCYLIIGRPQGQLKMDVSVFNEQMQDVLAKVDLKPEWFEDVGTITACMLNYFQKCGDKFLEIEDCFGVPFVELAFQVANKLAQQSLDQRHTHCMQFGLKLLNGLMENFRGKIDNHMPRVLGMVDELLKMDEKSNTTVSWLLSVISVALWYNPELTFGFFSKDSRTIEGWFESFALMTSDQDRERKMFALTQILMARPDSLPKNLIMDMLMKEIFQTTHLLIESKKCDMEDDGEYNDSYDSEYSEYYDDEDDAWSEDEDYEEEFENIYYDSPLLSHCSIVELKKVLEGLEKNNSNYFMQLIQCLSKEDQPKFSQMLVEAEKVFSNNSNSPNSSKFRG